MITSGMEVGWVFIGLLLSDGYIVFLYYLTVFGIIQFFLGAFIFEI